MATGSKGTARRREWPTMLGEDDDLMAVTNLETDEVEFLVFSSIEENSDFIRDRLGWRRVPNNFLETIDDPKYSIEFVDVDYIDEYDKATAPVRPPSAKTVIAAAESQCPPATLDIALNLKNRKRAIELAEYGPMNPNEQNEAFWKLKAEQWSVSPGEAKKSLCGNCVFFVVTSKMKKCIADGIESGGSASGDAWDAIDMADLGYCEAFDFKCAASRTCNAWVVGGPITDETKKKK
jgi:hypothetical protein